ncbi:MAG: hypothetical protein QNJ60_18365 [Xenococcaceae cyanobacterium MO_188.B19]|nr:hypothetical protein [Xenococcaceae cyanobacterium MO_188.B19]
MANQNPKTAHLKPYHYKTNRKESCTAKVTVRIAPSLKEKLKDVDNWQEGVREYLEKITETKSA